MNYKNMDINTEHTPKPWGAREEQAWKDIVDGLVVDSLGGLVDTVNGHQHNNLYAVVGDPAMVHVTAAGLVGINELAPDVRFHITEIVDRAVMQLEQQGNFNNIFQFLTLDEEASIINFGQAGDLDRGRIVYKHSAYPLNSVLEQDVMLFITNNAFAMMLDDSQNMGLGTQYPLHNVGSGVGDFTGYGAHIEAGINEQAYMIIEGGNLHPNGAGHGAASIIFADRNEGADDKIFEVEWDETVLAFRFLDDDTATGISVLKIAKTVVNWNVNNDDIDFVWESVDCTNLVKYDGADNSVVITGPADDTLIFEVITNAKNIMELTGTTIVFNQDQNDVDFRIEDTNETHAFMLRGSDGYVTFGGGGEPDEPLCINNLDNATYLKFEEVVNDTTNTNIIAAVRCKYNFGGGDATACLNLYTPPA